jgi:hypothetical protein
MNNDFQTKSYCLVRNAISSELRDFVTQYALFDEMQNYSANDDQVEGSHSKYGDPAMETMLLHLHELMERETGLKLFPTYSYYRVYRAGADLKPHTDRPSCEISATLCFNFSYDPKTTNWPIYMAGSRIDMMPGDLAIYRGCEIEHWREPFACSEDDWHVQGFFHFVDANGPHADFKFDKRESVGEKLQPQQKKNNSQPDYIQYL